MADVLSPVQRSYCMSRIRSKNTKPEIALRKLLWAQGLRYRLHGKLPGRPDMIFGPAKIAIFVDGCFWHGCPIHYRRPASNKKYWHPKIAKNMERDLRNRKQLKLEGWKVISVWEHDLKESVQSTAMKVLKAIRRHLKSG